MMSCRRKLLIIGLKGTGKYSIYRMIGEQAAKKDVLIENKDFGDFPFERLLKLDDVILLSLNQYKAFGKISY